MTISGIAKITNIENNKIFAFKSNNLEMQWEIYQNQLELNIHHNKILQRDWNDFGSDKFEFSIIEEIDDDFLLDDGFVDYVNLLEDNYNDFNISSFFFEYSSESDLIKLFDIIGRDECSSEFLEKLNNNDLSIEFYYELKNEIISLINSAFITEDEIEDKLTELILEKSHQIRVFNLDMQYKLINDLENTIGIAELKEDFIHKLKENNLIEAAGFTIQEEIMELIFSNNVIDNDIEKQIDSSIKLFKDRISKETIIKLFKKADALENDEEFINALQRSNLSRNISLKIINQLKELIESGVVNEDNFSQKLEELIDIEVENQWLETKKELFDYLAERIDSKEIIDRLNYSIHDVSILDQINQSAINFIENRKITSKEEIEEYIDNLVNKEISRIYDLKEELLSYVDMTYGGKDLTKEFENNLNSVQLSIEDGKKFISQLSSEISLFKINSIDQISEFLEKLIFERNTSLLIDLFNHLVGKEKNNESFSQKLKQNYLTDEDGNKIRNDLLKLIDSETSIEGVVNLRNTLEDRLDDLIQKQKNIYDEELKNIRLQLIDEVYNVIGKDSITDSFKNELYSNQLKLDYAETFKESMRNFICSDEIFDTQFNFKLDELIYLKEKGVEFKLNELIKQEADIKNNELIDIRNELNESLNELIGSKANNEYYSDLLKSNNLNVEEGNKIRVEINDLINSEEIINGRYEFKLDELLSLKQVGLKNYLNKLIKKEKTKYDQNLKQIREKLLSSLNLITSKESFKENLYSKQIDESFIGEINKELSDIIQSDTPCDDSFEVKLDELKFIDENGIDSNIDQLIKSEADIRQKELDELRNELINKVYSVIGKDKINMLFKFKLVNHNLKNEIGYKIRKELIDSISSKNCQDSNFNYKLAELKYLEDYGVENKIDDILDCETERYNNALKEKRAVLLDLINSMIGRDNLNNSFKNKLKSADLDENIANKIKQELIEFINADEVFDKKFEVKLDELIDLENNGIDIKIDEIINKEVRKKTLILKEKLLKELYSVTGDIPLSEEFTAKLNNADFDREMGIKIINHFKSEIDSLNIEEGFDFNSAIDDMIYDESRNILLEQTYELIGKESNSEYFTRKLKDNMISTKMGEDIRFELLSIIDNSELKELTDLRKVTMQSKFDEIILREYLSRSKKLAELKEKLIKELNDYISTESFKNNLIHKNLSVGYIDKIKNQMEGLINSEDVEGDFEFKVDELIDLNDKGLKNKIDDIVKRESEVINTKLEVLKKDLMSDLKTYIWPLDSSIKFSAIELRKRDLTIFTGRKACSKLKVLILSKEIKDSKFTSKYEELVDLKNTTVKTKFKEIIERYAKNQQDLIKFLHLKTLEDSSFNQKLRHRNLKKDFAENLVKNIEIKIKDNEYTKQSEITEAIEKYLNIEAVEQEKALNKLHDIVGKRGISLKFRAKLMLKGLSSDNGKKVVQIVENKIKTEGLRENKISDEIDRQLENFSKNNRNIKSKPSNSKEHVFCIQCGYKNRNDANFCIKCGARLHKL